SNNPPSPDFIDKLVYSLLYGRQLLVLLLILLLILGIKTYLTSKLLSLHICSLLHPRYLISSDIVMEVVKQYPILRLNSDTLGMNGAEVQICPVLVYCL